MKALILAAGLGSRLRPLTRTLPKPLIKIGSKSNLERNLLRLRRYGVKKVYINLHYLPAKITSFVGNGKKFGLEVRYSWEKVLLGTAGAIRKLKKELGKETFLVLYADNYVAVDIKKLLRYHSRKKGVATVALFKDHFDPHSSGLAKVSAQGRITRFIEKPKLVFSRWADAGVYVFEPEIFDFIPHKVGSSITKDLLTILMQNKKRVYGYRTREVVLSLDTPEKLARSQKLLKAQQI